MEGPAASSEPAVGPAVPHDRVERASRRVGFGRMVRGFQCDRQSPARRSSRKKADRGEDGVADPAPGGAQEIQCAIPGRVGIRADPLCKTRHAVEHGVEGPAEGRVVQVVADELQLGPARVGTVPLPQGAQGNAAGQGGDARDARPPVHAGPNQQVVRNRGGAGHGGEDRGDDLRIGLRRVLEGRRAHPAASSGRPPRPRRRPATDRRRSRRRRRRSRSSPPEARGARTAGGTAGSPAGTQCHGRDGGRARRPHSAGGRRASGWPGGRPAAG